MDHLEVRASTRRIPSPVRRAVIARDGMRCRYCRITVVNRSPVEPYQPDALHLDHVLPWSEGGDHTVDNLVVSCAGCNLTRPRPTNPRRHAAVRAEYRDGDHYWRNGYTPPVPLARWHRQNARRSVQQAARLFNKPPARIIRLIDVGNLPASVGDGPIRVWIDPEILGWLESRAQEREEAAERAAAERRRERQAKRVAARAAAPVPGPDIDWRALIAARRAREKAAKAAR